MHIETHLDVISACRFCFMCRHIDTTANVTFRESDTARGRALVLDRVRMNPELLANPDYIATLYDCALSAACRKHCVSHYDETGLVLSARMDVVEQNLTPANINGLVDSIMQDFAPAFTGQQNRLLLIQTISTKQVDDDLQELLNRAEIPFNVLSVNDVGKSPFVLGFRLQARQMALRIAEMIKQSGCSAVLTACPAVFDCLKNDYAQMDVSLGDIEVQHTSSFLLGHVTKIKHGMPMKNQCAYYTDSDFLRNYNDITLQPRQLLEAVGYQLMPFGTNPEESYAMGEGALVYDQIRPQLVSKMVTRFKQLMDHADDLIITSSPYTLAVLKREGINAMSLEQALHG